MTKRPIENESCNANKSHKTDSGDTPGKVNEDLSNEDEYSGGINLSASALPSAPHPAVKDLPPIDFSQLPENFFVLVYGARRTGKTWIVHHLLEQVADRFDYVYLFSETCRMHIGEAGETDFDMLVDDAKIEGFDIEALKEIIETQATTKIFNNSCKYKKDKKPNNTLLIFDDFVHDKNVRYSKEFTKLPVLGRHHDLSVICLSQGYSAVGSSGLNPATRQNADYVMTFLPRNIGDVERIADWYLAKGKLESMWFINTVCREEHQCLGIDLTKPHLTEFRDYCYKLIAPSDQRKYELGKEQWKQLKEEKKLAKQNAIYESVQAEKRYWCGASDLGKYNKLNQATGLPKKQLGQKPNLFQAVNQRF